MTILAFLVLAAILARSSLLHLLSPKHANLHDYVEYVKHINSLPTTSKFRAVFHPSNPNCNQFTDAFLSAVTKIPLVVINKNNRSKSHLGEMHEIYVFLSDVRYLPAALAQLHKQFIVDHSGVFQFVFCRSDERPDLAQLFKSTWNESMLSTLFIYYERKAFNVMGYNPFLKTVLNFTATYQRRELLSKNLLKNLHGYPLKASICNDYPRNGVENNQTYGHDLMLLQNIAGYMNATVRYINHRSCKSIINDMVQGTADLSFIGYFTSNNLNNVKYTYPRAMDDVLLLAPQLGTYPMYLNMFLIFSLKAWLSYFFFGAAILLVLYCFRVKTKARFAECFQDLLTITLNNPLATLKRQRTVAKVLLFAWSTNCFLYNSLFQSSLTSVYVRPHRTRNFRYLQELYDAKLDVYIPEDYAKLVPEENILKGQFVYDSKQNVINDIIGSEKNAAFALPTSYIWNIYRHNSTQKGNGRTQRGWMRPKYFVMYDRLVPGHKVYLFPAKSPYLSEINKYLKVDLEHVLSEQMNWNGRTRARGKLYLMDNKHTAFSLKHLQMSFYLLVGGLFAAIVTFCCELAYFRFCDSNHGNHQFSKFSLSFP